MTNSNEDRYFKKDGKTVNKKYIAKKHPKDNPAQKLFNKWYVLLLILLAILTISYNIYNHPYLKISQIHISGNHVIDDTEIIEKLDNPMGKNVLFYNPSQYEESIASIDRIDKVSASKVYPNIVNLRVKESYPRYYQKKGSDTYFISNTGILLGENLEDVNLDELVEIDGANLKDKVGENFTGSEATIKFIEKLEGFYYFSELKQLNLENKADIGIMINDIEVKFGDLNNIDYKLKLLEKVLNDIDDKSIDAVSINLNNGENPIVRVSSDTFRDDLN